MRALVTGANGLIGANVVRALLDAGHEVRAFVRDTSDLASVVGLDLEIVCPTMSAGPHGRQLGPSNAVVTTYLSDPFRLTFAGGCNIVSVEDVARGHLLAALHGRPGARYVLGGENLEWATI